MQNTELASIKNKIKAMSLRTVENGCTEHEAMAAMAMVGRLLAQYNLTMSEIDVREQVCTTVYIPTDRANQHPVSGCLTALSKFLDLKVWISSKREREGSKSVKRVSYAFFGQQQDLDMVQYLYNMIKGAIDNETERFKNSEQYRYNSTSRKTLSVSFQRGMVSRIAQRLYQMKKENDADVHQAAGSTSRALIVLKGQLVDEEFKKLNMKLKTAYATARTTNANAYYAGQAAGNKVNLSRPLGNSGTNHARLSAR